MVLAFTEEQKKEIEAKGMMVIEFKYNLRKAGKIIKETWCRMKQIVNKAGLQFVGFEKDKNRYMLSKERYQEEISQINFYEYTTLREKKC